MSLIVLGTVAIDNIITNQEKKVGLLGGSASHFSLAAKLFTDVHLVSVIGHDFPDEHISFFKKKKIDLTSLLKAEGKSFRWDGEYKIDNLNQAITHGTELGVLLNYAPQVADHQRHLPNVFLGNFDPKIQEKFLALMKKPEFVGMDTMNLWIVNARPDVTRLMKKVNLLVLNDGEAIEFSGEKNLIKAAKKLRSMGPELIVIKKGEHGVLFYSDKFMFSFPAFPVEHVVDPTGAGDTFAGALMGYLTKVRKVNEKNLRQAVIYATTVASFNVEGFGHAQTKNLTMAKVNQRMKKLIKFITP